jgi:Ni,Fe-hydrogenase I large subunit
MKEIVIDPITRLEGHGNVSIFLNDQGEVENAYLKIPELRGFEKFCIGRRAELMPQLTTRICGVCPVAHHFAAVKALDQAFNVEPTSQQRNSANSCTMPTSFTTTPYTSTTSVDQTSSLDQTHQQKNATSSASSKKSVCQLRRKS